MGRADLIGNGRHQLVPAWQPTATGTARTRRPHRPFLTQHTGLPRVPQSAAAQPGPKAKRTEARAQRRKARG
jgi:hypothetical protein